ncbi:MAG: DUF1343 domain-containing protein [Puniceicoccales bacterium]|jgi:uncharacterized protein YbbC (DUF1343 family)|nr:DUF1343 domain-containing protein [Puniceicoccales bacterium]
MTNWLCNLRQFRFTTLLFICFFAHLEAKLLVGIDVLQEKKFSTIKNKKVALLTHAAAINSQKEPTLDVFLTSKDAKLKVLLLPEHNGGFSDSQLEEVKKRGISVYSTHRPTSRAPELEWLKEVDAVVIDIQDIGVRYYTYGSSVLYAMVKAFETGKECVILDRPNPLGDYIGGPTMDKKYLCFLGPIEDEPLFCGMTIGEKANYVKNCGQNFDIKCTCGMNACDHGIFCSANTLKKGKLTIIKMKGWDRKKILTEFAPYTPELAINLSPSLQNVASIFEYALSGLVILLGENFIKFLNKIENPQCPGHKFKYFQAPHFSVSTLLKSVTDDYPFALKGCQLRTSTIKNNASSISEVECLELSITKFSSTEPAILSLALFALAQEWVPEADWEAFEKATFPAAPAAAKVLPVLANATKIAPPDVKNSLSSTTSTANELPDNVVIISDLSPQLAAAKALPVLANATKIAPSDVKNFQPTTSAAANKLPDNAVIISDHASSLVTTKTLPVLANATATTMTDAPAAVFVFDLKNLTPAQQKALRKAKWDRLTKLKHELVQKHIGDGELLDIIFNGKSIDVNHFRNKWILSATHFYNKTKKYYLY